MQRCIVLNRVCVSEPRVREKRAASSSSSSSTSTELCDDPAASDCCGSQRSSDDEEEDDGGGDDFSNGGSTVAGGGDGAAVVVDVVVECRRSSDVVVRTAKGPRAVDDCDDDDDDDDDEVVSLAEVLRTNSEMLNRMCGKGSPEKTAAAAADTSDRLPDLINDIDAPALGGRLAGTAVEGTARLSYEPVREPTTRPERGDDGDERIDFAATTTPSKPFAPFPSKVRQPKRLGIELGLYPNGSN